MPVGACGIACACACMPVCVYFEERSCTTALCLFIQTAVCDEGLATPPDKKTSSSVHPGRGVLMYRLSLSLLLPSLSLNLSSPHTHHHSPCDSSAATLLAHTTVECAQSGLNTEININGAAWWSSQTGSRERR